MKQETKKLAAILFADIQGYTAMMQEDDERAFFCVEKFKEAIHRFVPQNSGQVVQFYGDGVLILFNSASDAVQCALDIQNEYRSEPIVPVRIGLNDGEVLLRDDNAFGDSINIASRIESIGIPGSILFSGSIYDQIHNKKKYKTKFVGKFHFKNVNQEIDVHALANDDLPIPEKGHVSGKLKEKKPLPFWKIALASMIIIVAAVWLGLKLIPHSGEIEDPLTKAWLGNWSQTIQSSPADITGMVQFVDTIGFLQGSSRNEYGSNAASTTNQLFDIILSEDGQTISGNWLTIEWKDRFENRYRGTFSFELAESKRGFTGQYAIVGDTTTYYWNGTRN